MIIPRKGLGELKRLVDEDDAEEIDLAFANNSGLARKGDVTLVMRLIEGEFPDYNQVLPRDLSRHLVLATDALTQAVRRVALLSSERSRALKLELSEGQLVISSSNPDLGDAREELDVDFAGDPLTVGFNARYLLDAISAIQEKEVRFSFHDELSPARLTPAGRREDAGRRDADAHLNLGIDENASSPAAESLVNENSRDFGFARPSGFRYFCSAFETVSGRSTQSRIQPVERGLPPRCRGFATGETGAGCATRTEPDAGWGWRASHAWARSL